jgi:hypothetical protein
VLEARLCAPTSAQRDVQRARIVLLAAKGSSTRSIARELQTNAADGQPVAGPVRARGSGGPGGASPPGAAAEVRVGDRLAHPGDDRVAAAGRFCSREPAH